jgi:hypothetical protein
MVNLDQSYYIEPPLGIRVHTAGSGFGFASTSFGGGAFGGSAASSSQFVDAASYQDCYRADSHVKVYEFPRRDVNGNRISPPDLGPAVPATPTEEPTL